MGVETPCEGLKLHVARGVTTLEVEIIHAVLNFDGQFGSRGQGQNTSVGKNKVWQIL